MNSKDIKTERTLVIIKPDGVQRSLVGEVIGRFEKIGIKIVALKFMQPTKELVEKHYLVDPNWRETVGAKNMQFMKERGEKTDKTEREIGDGILDTLKNYFTKGPVVTIVLEGPHSVELVRKLVGGTEPLTSDVGTIRGDYVLDSYKLADGEGRSIHNLIHASSSVEDAKKEIDVWFSKEELIDYITAQERMLHEMSIK